MPVITIVVGFFVLCVLALTIQNVILARRTSLQALIHMAKSEEPYVAKRAARELERRGWAPLDDGETFKSCWVYVGRST